MAMTGSELLQDVPPRALSGAHMERKRRHRGLCPGITSEVVRPPETLAWLCEERRKGEGRAGGDGAEREWGEAGKKEEVFFFFLFNHTRIRPI